jgi:cation transport regulator ChaC
METFIYSLYPVFSYGSNSISQLRARVNNLTLQSYPGYINDYKRIFCNYSKKWDGGVATLIPKKNIKTYGIIVYLTQEELEKLDSYEINYRKELLECYLIQKNQEKEEKIDCIVYVSNDNTWIQSPSQQYLTAIKVMLEEFQLFSGGFVPDVEKVDLIHTQSYIIISGFIDGKLTNLEKWSFDRNINNLSLESLFVIINSKKEKPWIMPKTLGHIIKKLNAINIYDKYDLIKNFEYLNNKLQEKNYNTFSEETCKLIKTIIKSDQKDSKYLII